LIVCEGECTEPNYFRRFPVTSAAVEVVGVGCDPKSLVAEAKKLKDDEAARSQAEGMRGGYDQVWCVFDKDSISDHDFRQAIAKARRLGFNVAYTNEAFELWYLLHYDYNDAALSRTQYASKLTEQLGRPYHKNDPAMYETLLRMQPVAIQNATKLRRQYEPHDPAKDNPCTTVHQLVTEMNRWQR
jgi:hypothetical protein